MRPQRRKLLVATVGVAAINYLACQQSDLFTSGNLMSPNADARPDQFISSGNLVAPEAGPDADPHDADHDAAQDADLDADHDADLDANTDAGDAAP